MPDDAELLRLYATDRSECAFAELMRRHLNFVYTCALRRVGRDSHLADDVTQSVFCDLARKAALLSTHPILTGWLFTSTRYAAAKAIRAERRRKMRENKAYTMHEASHDPTPVSDWEHLRPLLDDALDRLNKNDREIVLLHFVEEQPFPAIGARLSLTNSAARLRVERALEKMRTALARQGVRSSAAALATALSSQATVTAPAHLPGSTLKVALAGAASRGGIVTALKLFVAMNKINAGIASGILAVGVSIAIVELHANRRLTTEVNALQTEDLNLPAQPEPRTAKNSNLEADELARLNNRIARLKARPDGVVDSAMIPRSAWRNIGRATPAAALETLIWAHSVHDMGAIADSYVFSNSTKQIMDAWFAGLNENVRTKFGTPERLLAPLLRSLAGDRSDPVMAYQVIDQQNDLGPDTVKIPYWVQLASGKEQEAEMGATEFKKVGDSWKKYGRGPATKAQWEKTVSSKIDPTTGEPVSEGTGQATTPDTSRAP